jgi:hypothetical protein
LCPSIAEPCESQFGHCDWGHNYNYNYNDDDEQQRVQLAIILFLVVGLKQS